MTTVATGLELELHEAGPAREGADGLGQEQSLGRRLASIYGYLTNALYQADPERAIVDRLASALDSEVTIFDREGGVGISTSSPIPEAVSSVLADRPRMPRSLTASGWSAHAMPIGSAGERCRGWLVVFRKSWGDASPDLTRMVAGCAAPLIAAVWQLHDLGRAQETAVREDLLKEILRPGLDDRRVDHGVLASRSAVFGFERERFSRAVLLRLPVEGARSDSKAVAELSSSLEAMFERVGIAHLLSAESDGVLALAQGDGAELRVRLESLLVRRPGLLVGIGRKVDDLAQAFESMCDARAAVDQLVCTCGEEAGVLDFENLDLRGLIAVEGSRGRIGAKLRELIEELKADPAAYEALVAFLRHDQSVSTAARSLFLHPNTLRYRLGKAEAILGGPLKDPATITTLYIAMAAEVRGNRTDGPGNR